MLPVKTPCNIGDVDHSLLREDGTCEYPSNLKKMKIELYVCVKNMRGKPLMPTTCREARLLLKQGNAVIAGYRPFTIQLKYATGETKQNLVLGIDAGYSDIGFSVTSPGFLDSPI